MTTHYFKNGDEVPVWVSAVTPAVLQHLLTFGHDVRVEREDDGVHIYPVNELAAGDFMMRMADHGETKVHILGAPVKFWKYPFGDERNYHPAGYMLHFTEPKP
jgi:hypothetical protein